jgi:hypothetical protein
VEYRIINVIMYGPVSVLVAQDIGVEYRIINVIIYGLASVLVTQDIECRMSNYQRNYVWSGVRVSSSGYRV